MPSRSSILSSASMEWRLFLLLLAWTVVVQRPDGVGACLSGTFAESLPRTVTWSSTPTILEPWRQVVPFLFHPPNFLDRWSKADFALINATLSLPCSVIQHQPEIVLVPEVWIEFLPSLEAGARQYQPARTMCDLFILSNTSRDFIPGCQDWNLIEAWKRLRIFYDIQAPISVPDAVTAHQRQCNNSASDDITWSVSVSSMIKQWMTNRSPWTRSNATMPIVIVSRRPELQQRPVSVQAELQLTYWMDSKSWSLISIRSVS